MDMGNSSTMLRAMLPRLPLVLKTALLNSLSLSSTEGKQDLRTELTVNVMRSFIGYDIPVSKQQEASTRDPGVKGPMWVSKVELPKPEIEVQDALIQVIEALKEGGETYDVPGLADVGAEWTGYRADADEKSTLPDISEEEKYEKLMEEVEEDATILYFHGGAFFAMDPCSHRVVTAKLAELTKSRVLSVRYRLAPQHPFPAALLDCLVAYLSLISPPPGSLHSAVPASKIVLAGDSAGGNLAIVLLQTLLSLRRLTSTIRFHGNDIPVELPAGVAANSPFCDLTRSMPSVHDNAKFDFLSPPSQVPGTIFTPYPFPSDDIWPSNPPRIEFYANANALAHPLVSPLCATADLWVSSPPIFMTMGEEGLADEGLHLARKIRRAGSATIVEQFEGMPHCFALIMPSTPLVQRCYEGWANFCRTVSYGNVTKSSSRMTWVNKSAKDSARMSLEEVCNMSDEDAVKRVKDGRDWRVEGEAVLVNAVEEEASKSKL